MIEARLALAMSQEELAAATMLSVRTIQRLEAGGKPSLESIKALRAVLGQAIVDPKTGPTLPEARASTPDISTANAQAPRQVRATTWVAVVATVCLGLCAAWVTGIAFVKMFEPAHVGLWLGEDSLILGWEDNPTASRELLGPWVFPLSLLLIVSTVRAAKSLHIPHQNEE